jgi:hypothetical protein
MRPAGFKPEVSAIEQRQTYVLDRTLPRIGVPSMITETSSARKEHLFNINKKLHMKFNFLTTITMEKIVM